LDQYQHDDIRQGYVSIAEDGAEVRIRQKGDKYFQTKKSGTGKVRTEEEKEITQDEFESLWPTTEGRTVEKTRYKIPIEGGMIELDIYKGDRLNGLVTAEIEFKSQEDSEKFVPPDWLSNEVTTDQRYKNQSLALHGSPDSQ
jgi:CYTH domain-containing protein